MILARENEAESQLLCAFPQTRRRQIDGNTERFEHIGAAATRRDAAIAMLHHGRATRREHKHDRGRDIKKIEAVTPSAADVDHRSG